MSTDGREYRNQRRDRPRVFDVSNIRRRVSTPAPTREQQQAAARAQWDVALILENYRTERPGNDE